MQEQNNSKITKDKTQDQKWEERKKYLLNVVQKKLSLKAQLFQQEQLYKLLIKNKEYVANDDKLFICDMLQKAMLEKLLEHMLKDVDLTQNEPKDILYTALIKYETSKHYKTHLDFYKQRYSTLLQRQQELTAEYQQKLIDKPVEYPQSLKDEIMEFNKELSEGDEQTYGTKQ